MRFEETTVGGLSSVLSVLKQSTGYWIVMVCLLIFTITATAQTGLTLQLVPETTAIVPGKPFRVGLFIQHEPGWHTYWRQPGIVGVPTNIEWELPPGFKAGELEYPEPESVKMFQITAQGYERDVLLQTQITPPSDLKPGQTISLNGKATWMCCGDTCHPGQMKLSLDLPTAIKATPDAKWQPLFEKERADYARTSSAWTSQAEEEGLKVTLILKPAAGARPFSADEKVIFFTEDGWINSDEPQPQELNAKGDLTIHLTRADVYLSKTIPSKLKGIVQRDGGWAKGEPWRSLSIEPTIERK